MRGLARVVWVAVAAWVFVLCGLASAAKFRNESLTATGAFTFTWQGDGTRGCAAVGLCDVRGEVILTPNGGGELVSFGARAAQISMDASGSVRVLRGGPNPGECIDIPSQTPSGLTISLTSRAGLRAVIQTPTGSGRCPGPLQTDLSSISIPIRRTPGSRPSFDLRGSRSFGAGPFTVRFVSSVLLRPQRNIGMSAFGGSSSFSSSGPGHTLSPIVEFVQLRFQVSASSTSIQTLFSGAHDGSCVILDSCGASGSLNLSVRPSSTLTVLASRIVRRRPSRGGILRDLRAGRLTLGGYSNLRGQVSESYTWADGSTCHDAVDTPLLQLSLGFPGPGGSRGRVPVTILSNPGPGVQTMRTHCPGPADADLLSQSSPFGGGQSILAQGSLTAGELLSKHLTLTLTEPSEFTGLGYTGSRQGSVRLDLTLQKVSPGMNGGR